MHVCVCTCAWFTAHRSNTWGFPSPKVLEEREQRPRTQQMRNKCTWSLLTMELVKLSAHL